MGKEETQIGVEYPLVEPGLDYTSVTEKIADIVLQRRHPRGWIYGFLLAFTLVMVLIYGTIHLFFKGVGIWGVNVPVVWGIAIVNFVWWIGIGHAGTLISAILVLMRQDWRTSISRFAEAMTLFAVACAAMFPLLHLGRPWMFYYILPYPNTMGLWPQFRSPLTWDFFAILTYLCVSLLFWYVGLLPDLGAMRDRAKKRINQVLFGVFALGWRGSARHWHRYETTYLLLAGLATPLVVSVHSIVSLDFAVSILPGWHTTIFPPYFVAGAIFSGFAMVLTLIIPVRRIYGLERMITMRHLDFCAKVMLATGLLTSYGYVNEAFFAWYSGNEFEMYMMENRMTGPYMQLFWTVIFCNLFAIQLIWFKRVRRSAGGLFALSLLVNLGMWLERYIIVVASLHRDFLPSAWDMYRGTIWDWAIFAGTIGFFFACIFLFIRFLPMISMAEMRELLHEQKGEYQPEEGATRSPHTHQKTEA